MSKDFFPYNDIIHLPHPESKKHPRMDVSNRAAQFAPFAALTGYEGQISSARHPRCNRISLSEEEIADINSMLLSLRKSDSVKLTYFCEDYGTDGAGGMAEGVYRELTGTVLSLSPSDQLLRLAADGQELSVSFKDILEIQRDTLSYE